jgi:hypothetical protein
MSLTLTAALFIFGAGLLIGRKQPLVLASAVALALGLAVADEPAGVFVHTLLDGAARLVL